MNVKEKITLDMQKAMKNKEKIKVQTLRSLKSKIKEKEIEKKSMLDENEIIKIIKSAEKQRIDSAEQFKNGNRTDLEKIELDEIKIIKNYLPKQLSNTELSNLVDSVINELNATSIKDIGKVMSQLMKKLSGTANGKLVQSLVKEKLEN